MSRAYDHDQHPILDAEQDGYSTAARTWRPLLQPGMEVAAMGGDIVGQVKEVRAADFLVDCSSGLGLGPEALLYVPYERIHVMLANKMTLDVPSSQLDEFAEPPSSYRL